jgi:hypothetical protein
MLILLFNSNVKLPKGKRKPRRWCPSHLCGIAPSAWWSLISNKAGLRGVTGDMEGSIVMGDPQELDGLFSMEIRENMDDN